MYLNLSFHHFKIYWQKFMKIHVCILKNREYLELMEIGHRYVYLMLKKNFEYSWFSVYH
jgi:hypothetical protein